MKNDRFTRALRGEPLDRPPVWMMRQAGRYLPEYRAMRAKVEDFIEFCQSPELAAEAMLQPLRRFDLDASILFSDILVVPHAMGMDLQFVQNEGPVFSQPIRDASGVSALKPVDVDTSLGFVRRVIDTVRPSLDVPLIGFAGSPWTVATYMVEGRSSRFFQTIKQWLYTDPAGLHTLLEKVAQVTIDYLNMQIDAGVDAIQLFDTWGGVLSAADYETFSLAYMNKIKQGLKPNVSGASVPVIFFTKGAGAWLPTLLDSDADGVGLDWTVSMGAAMTQAAGRKVLQGNLDPFVLFGSRDKVRASVHALLDEVAGRPGFIFNLGHGIQKDTPIAAVEWMMEALHDWAG